MPQLIFKYWKEISFLAAALLLVVFFGLWRIEVIAHKNTKDKLTVARNTIINHENNTELVERLNNEYQNSLNQLNNDVKRLRQRPAKCVTVSPASGVHSGSGSGREYDSENGISTQWLGEYAIKAETYRIERNACKSFVNQVWDSR